MNVFKKLSIDFLDQLYPMRNPDFNEKFIECRVCSFEYHKIPWFVRFKLKLMNEKLWEIESKDGEHYIVELYGDMTLERFETNCDKSEDKEFPLSIAENDMRKV